MSVLLTTSNDILKHPTNNSASKMQYSFNREPRFDALYKAANPNPNRNVSYFEGPQYKKLSTLNAEYGKIGKFIRKDNVFIDINRHQLKTPSS